jgi:uncharacterized protein YndB with AHSA1/START domain
MPAELDAVGRTADAGWQVGVRRTLPFSEERIWAVLLAPEGLQAWLGGPAEIAEGTPYTLENGTSGRIGVYKPWSHIRLTWQPEGWAQPSTLQVRVIPAKTGTTLSFHHEQLRGETERTAMKARWERVIERLAAMLQRAAHPADARG